MSDPNADPRILPDPGAMPKGSIWLRGLMMLIFALLIGLALTVLNALTLIQFVLMVFDKGQPNTQIVRFGTSLGGWLAKAVAYQTARTEAKPWPFEA